MAIAVQTRFGRLQGTVDRRVHSFRGIPFARAALGSLRFRPPEPPASWNGTREAIRFAPAAPQNPSLVAALSLNPVQDQSEDCLYLNVWTPGIGGRPRPVLVWIHGGRGVEGAASLPDYNGHRLARRGDVVVVTLQYRLGALGFLHAPELGPDCANLGLLDQIAALEWVRAEIDMFGGDPTNVTLFGSGTGATCVSALLAMPRARGLFQRAILQSPRLDVHDAESGARVTQVLLEELGLAPDQTLRLRDVGLDRLLEAQQRCEARLDPDPLATVFAPVVDGAHLPLAPREALRNGLARGVPLLVGSNLAETKLLALANPNWEAPDETALVRRLEEELSGDTNLARRALELYRAQLGRSTELADLLHAIETDRLFRSAASRVAELQSAHEPRTYAYLFQGTKLGEALHGLEVPFVFGTLEDHSLRNLVGKTEHATTLARQIQDAWIAFALTGDPGHYSLGTWPAYAPPRRATMILGEKCHVEDAPQDNERRFWFEVLGERP